MSLPFSSSMRVRGAFLVVLVGLVFGTVGCDGGGASEEPPASPSGVQVTSQDGAIGLTWEGASEASGFNVYRSTSSMSSVSGSPVNGDAPLDQTSFTDESVDNGTHYYYRITAVGGGGESDPSSEVSARPFPSPPNRP